ncbi:MAG: glycosyltransferase [Abditibacteriales bacterium]|nr:glycosyltransferase [Abditibacteriales bacterium]MDW8365301.1 glycosyltransferase [Abditibacteriales bacterium]
MKPPLFSIIIPTYARPKPLSACLESLAHLDYPRDRFEVIVVDDGSEVPLQPVVSAFQSRFNLTLLKQANAGPATARNTGAAQAQGEFLAFTDDDCTPAADWLQALAARVAASPDCMIGGRTLNALPDNPYSTASQWLIDYLYTYYNADPHQACFFTSNNLAIPAAHFRALGGFDTTYPHAAAEDREFCDRWRYYGYRLVYAPEVVVYHAHALTLRTFWRQHFHYGGGAFRFHQTRARRGAGRIRLESPSFYMNLLRYPFSQAQGRQALLVAALLVLSQGANAVGFLWERLRQTYRLNHR